MKKHALKIYTSFLAAVLPINFIHRTESVVKKNYSVQKQERLDTAF